MAQHNRPSVVKRAREQQRAEKRREKAARRAGQQAAKEAERVEGAEGATTEEPTVTAE